MSARFTSVLIALVAAVGCRPEHAKGISASEAPRYERASTIAITGGKILVDKPGAYDRPCPGTISPVPKGGTGCAEHHFYVYPVVDTTWTASDPIPAWVTCAGNHKTLASCETEVKAYSGELGGKVVVRVGDASRPGRTTSGWELAVEDSLKRHGLAASNRAPVMVLGNW